MKKEPLAEREITAQELAEALRPMLGPLRAFQRLSLVIDGAVQLESRCQSLQRQAAQAEEKVRQIDLETGMHEAALATIIADQRQAEKVSVQMLTELQAEVEQEQQRLLSARQMTARATKESEKFRGAEFAKVDAEVSDRRAVLNEIERQRQLEWDAREEDRLAQWASQEQEHAAFLIESRVVWQREQDQLADQRAKELQEWQARHLSMEKEANDWQSKIDTLKEDFQALISRIKGV